MDSKTIHIRKPACTAATAVIAAVVAAVLLALPTAPAAAATAPQDAGGYGVKITAFDESDGFAESRVTNVIQDAEGLIWVATWDGLYRYDGYRFVSFKARPGDNCPLETNRINNIRELDKGRILCRLVTGKHYIFSKATRLFEPYRGRERLADTQEPPADSVKEKVKGIPCFANIPVQVRCTDRQGGIWVYSNLGLNRIRFARKPIGSVKLGTGGEEQVRGLMEDHAGRLWVADRNGFVRVMGRRGRLVGYLTPDGRIDSHRTPFGYKVYSMHEDRKGRIWLGTKFGGLFRLLPAGPEHYTIERFTTNADNKGSISHNSVYSVVEDGLGRIWVGTYGGGLNLVDESREDGTTGFINHRNSMKPLHKGEVEIHSMLVTATGVLLVGTNEGLFSAQIEKKPDEMKFYNNRRRPDDAASLSNNRVMDIIQTGRGEVFIATYGGGLCRVLSAGLLSDTLHFKPYTTAEGIASDVNMAAVEDHNGKVWVVSEASVSCLDTDTEFFTNFKKSIFRDKLVMQEVHPLCTADGKLVMGTSQGTIEFNPSEMTKSGFVPKIVSESPDTIHLTADMRRLAISIAALDYNKNETIEYAYMIEGTDNTWNYTTDSRIVYANIPPGQHTLRVRSTNGDGIWVDNERTFTVCRTPSFNETPYAWMLYGGLLLLMAYVAVKVIKYIRRLQKEISDIKLTVNEKMEYMLLKGGEKIASTEKTVKKQLTNQEQVSKEKVAQNSDIKLKEAVELYIQEHIADAGMSVEDMAKATGMSRSVLYLSMKRLFGLTPNSFIQEARIARAKQLIADTDRNISEVAYMCGFTDPKYFSRCFKKMTGMKPTDYKKAQAEGGVKD